MWLDDWAKQHGVSHAALSALKIGMGIDAAPGLAEGGVSGSESRQQSLVRLDAANYNVWLTRNNVGALIDERGVPVRYGLANESKAQNKRIKSADLIGIKKRLIGPHDVGKVIGQFVSREVKHEGWKYKGDKHEVAQLAWCNFILQQGGDAAFTTGKYL